MTDLFGNMPPARKPRTSGGMGGHQSASAATTTWLTPPHVIQALGGADSFDLDPCGVPGWRTAREAYCLPTDGLARAWPKRARVWLNPPYTTVEVDEWMGRLAAHGVGTALVFARTDTGWWARQVRDQAAGVLFLEGRLHFHHKDGRRAEANAGAPSVLCAYGQDDLDRLAECGLPGMFAPLRFSRFIVVAAAHESWRDLVLQQVRAARGPVSVADLYRAVGRHPRARENRHWRAKVRQTLQRGPFRPVARGVWAEAA